ncbi:MAG: CotH kinase family protein [Lachnospiraceae bacterium]|nr:CotH kinase family protein [Lachnospiraceae bacterium]
MKKTAGIISGFFLVIFMTIFSFTFLPNLAYADNGLPRMEIKLRDITLEGLNSGEKKVEYAGNTVAIYDAGGSLSHFQENVRIQGRGNTTWDKRKKPYQIRLTDRVNFFGLGATRRWVLLANYYDSTHLRNAFALSLARKMGISGTTDGVHVELYVDGDYLGLYYLCHKAEISDVVLDLHHEDAIIMELDQPYLEEDIDFYSNYGDHLCLKDSLSEDPEVKKRAVAAFARKWNALCYYAKTGNWKEVSSRIDVDSFANYYILNEFAFNLDATLTSFFVYTDGPNDVIHTGPAWDFDKCLGNRWGGATELMWAYQSLHNENDPNTHLIMWLMDIPQFRTRVVELWGGLVREYIHEAKAEILETADSIRQAAEINNEKWNRDDFSISLNNFAGWIDARIDILDRWLVMRDPVTPGTYLMEADGLFLTANGLSSTSGIVRLEILPDGHCLVGSIDGSSYLTGGNHAMLMNMDDPTAPLLLPDTVREAGTAGTVSSDGDTAVKPGEYRYVPVAEPRQNITAQEWMTQVSSDGSVRFYNKDSGRYICVYKGQLVEKEPGVDGNRHFTIRADFTKKELAARFVESIATRHKNLRSYINGLQTRLMQKAQY